MNQRSTRDQMLVGAADILGERLAAAMIRAAEAENRVEELAKSNSIREQRIVELEASIKAAKQAMAYNDHHDAFLMLQAVLAKGREG